MTAALITLVWVFALTGVLTSIAGALFNRQSSEYRREQLMKTEYELGRLNAQVLLAEEQAERARNLLAALPALPNEAQLLADRCDQQAEWLSQGDPRGIYGEYLPYVYVDWPAFGIEDTEQTLVDRLHPKVENCRETLAELMASDFELLTAMYSIPGPDIGTPAGGRIFTSHEQSVLIAESL